jgi:hypothetical protein
MKRLAEIMPKSAAEKATNPTFPMRIELHPIRQAADSFASWMNDDLPANKEELHAMLWVFGEILNGEMERMMNVNIRQIDSLLNSSPFSMCNIKLEDTDGREPEPTV